MARGKSKSAGFSKFRARWWALCEIERQVRRGRSCTCRSLAADLGVDSRTVRRYIAFLREDLGAPIQYDPIDERYELTNPSWTMPNIHLTDEEMVALAVASRSLAALTPHPLAGPLEKLLAKLLDALPEYRKEEIAKLRERVEIVPVAVKSKGAEWVGPLLDAIAEEQTVRMTYHALSRGKDSERRVDPYHLRFFAGAWYLIGYDQALRQFPVFNLARVRNLEVTEDSFRRKPFSAGEYFKHSFGITVGGTPRTVRVRLVGRAARTAGEKIWPEGFTYTPQTDGSGLLVGQVSHMDDLVAWAGSFDGEAIILPD